MQDQPHQIAMPGSELAPVGGPNDNAAASVGEEDARQFILRVKQTVERCVAQGMDKAQMFRAIREEGLQLGAAFAVYKELRDQNPGFFKDYFCRIDLKEQCQWLNRLVQACRQVGRNNAEDGVRVPETVTPQIAMEETDVPVNTDNWADHQALQAWSSSGGSHQLVDLPAGEQVPDHGQPVATSASVPLAVACPQQEPNFPDWEQLLHDHEQPSANGAFQGVAWPHQQALHLPATQQLNYRDEMAANGGLPGQVWQQQEVQWQAGQQLHDHQQPAANVGFQEFTWCQQAAHMPAAQLRYHEQAVVANGFPPPETSSAAGLPHEAIMDPWVLSHVGQSLWQGHHQAGTLGHWWNGASANPLPSSSLSEPREDQHYY